MTRIRADELGRVLVVGGAGFVGRALVSRLLHMGLWVRVATRTPLPGLASDVCEVCVGNLDDSQFCESILGGIDSVYYVAGKKKNIHAHLTTPFDFVLENCAPLLTFMGVLRNCDAVKRLAYLSTTHVLLDGKNSVNGYVSGKIINESILQAFREQTGLPVMVVRPPAIYGPGNRFGEGANFIPALIERVAKSGDTVTVWGTGVQQMQFIYIDDLIENLINVYKENSGVITVGNPEVHSVDEVVSLTLGVMGVTKKVIYDSTKPDGVSSLQVFDNIVTPKVSLIDGLAQTVEFFRMR